MRPYIGDGHDLTFYIAGEAGLYPACRFNCRLMAHHQTAALLRAVEAQPDKADELFAKAIAERLTGWSYEAEPGKWRPLDDAEGNKLAITPANVGGLAFNLFVRVRDVVIGLKPADADPATGQAAKTPEQNEKN